MNKADSIIIGAGIIGMSMARELAMRGQSVIVFDRGRSGMESSWAAGGILSPMRPWSEDPFSYRLSEQGKALYPNFVSELNEETGIDSELLRSGLIIIEPGHIDKTKQWAKERLTKIVNVDDVGSGVNLPSNAILLPDICQLRPPRLLQALRQSLRQLSVPVYEDTPIDRISTRNNRFEYVGHSGQQTYADAVIVCAGSWSQSILASICHGLSIKPIHGQMLCLVPDRKTVDHIIIDNGHYLIPRRDGKILIGSTIEDIGFAKVTGCQTKDELMKWACHIIPHLHTARLQKHWSGLRPFTERGRPYIGHIPNYENIFINAGHFRKGILQALSSARLLADYILDQPEATDISAFRI